MNSKEIFAIIKILIEYRAFPKENMDRLIDNSRTNQRTEFYQRFNVE